ncbi:MAG: hypothetical protein JXR37_13380 [Kiritimatiellae bacterium]|nr:hypothetical protein [Kiritimatiellia bacterium]
MRAGHNRHAARKHGVPVSLRFEPMHTFWGEPFKRHFSDTALRKAWQAALQRPDNVLYRSCAPRPEFAVRTVRRVVMEHFQEGDFQLVFRTRVRLAAGKTIRLCTLVAKDTGSFSRIAQTEYRNLSQLHGRAPGDVVRPLAGGFVVLPSLPHGRQGGLFCYCTPWLSDFHELGVNRKLNFYINERPFHHFDRSTSDQIRRRILEICLRLYDPRSQTAIEPPRIGAGDFMITRPAPGRALRLKLIAARRILGNVDLDACLSLYLRYQADWGGKRFSFLPASRDDLVKTVHNSLVREKGYDPARVKKALNRALQGC